MEKLLRSILPPVPAMRLYWWLRARRMDVLHVYWWAWARLIDLRVLVVIDIYHGHGLALARYRFAGLVHRLRSGR